MNELVLGDDSGSLTDVDIRPGTPLAATRRTVALPFDKYHDNSERLGYRCCVDGGRHLSIKNGGDRHSRGMRSTLTTFVDGRHRCRCAKTTDGTRRFRNSLTAM